MSEKLHPKVNKEGEKQHFSGMIISDTPYPKDFFQTNHIL